MVEHIVMDWEREARTGIGEAVLCAGKTPDQIGRIVQLARQSGRRLLLTRFEHEPFHCLDASARDALDYDAPSRTAMLGGAAPEAASDMAVIVCAGTSD